MNKRLSLPLSLSQHVLQQGCWSAWVGLGLVGFVLQMDRLFEHGIASSFKVYGVLVMAVVSSFSDDKHGVKVKNLMDGFILLERE